MLLLLTLAFFLGYQVQRQLTALGSDIHKGVLLKYNFSFYNNPHFYQR